MMKDVLEVNNLKKELGSFSLEQLTFSLRKAV